MHKKVEEENVAKVIKIYRDLSEAVKKYQVDNGCIGHVNYCGITSSYLFEQLIKKTMVISKSCRTNEECAVADWLPEKDTLLNGNEQTYAWQGVSKINHHAYLLSDGTIVGAHVESAGNIIIFIDINGKRKPNKVGQDVFPMTIGTRHGSILDNRYPIIAPYIADDENHAPNSGLCTLLNNESVCNPDICTQTNCSPTAYVLKHKKLPKINW